MERGRFVTLIARPRRKRCLTGRRSGSTQDQQDAPRAPDGMLGDSAQPCRLASSRESTRTRLHPLLIPRSRVRIPPGPSRFAGFCPDRLQVVAANSDRSGGRCSLFELVSWDFRSPSRWRVDRRQPLRETARRRRCRRRERRLRKAEMGGAPGKGLASVARRWWPARFPGRGALLRGRRSISQVRPLRSRRFRSLGGQVYRYPRLRIGDHERAQDLAPGEPEYAGQRHIPPPRHMGSKSPRSQSTVCRRASTTRPYASGWATARVRLEPSLQADERRPLPETPVAAS